MGSFLLHARACACSPCVCAVTVCVPCLYMHSAKCLHTGSWGRRRVGRHPQLLAMAEPAWHRQLGAAPLPLCPWHSFPCGWGEGEESAWRLSRPAGLPAHGWGARARGPDAAAHEQLFSSSHLLTARAVTRSPELHFPLGMLPSWLCPRPDLHSASALPVPSFTVPCCHLFPCLKAQPAAFTLSHF